MTQERRCDSCKKIFLKKEMIKIIDSKNRIWYRCKKCMKKWGYKPRSNGYYTALQFEGVMVFGEDKKMMNNRGLNKK